MAKTTTVTKAKGTSITKKAKSSTDAKKAKDITITKKAAEKILEMSKEEKKENYGLKLFVFPGGCSGLQYGMDFEKKASKDDITFEQHGVKVFVEKDILEYVKGTKVDYVETKDGSGFKINNPQASSSNSSGCSSCSGCN